MRTNLEPFAMVPRDLIAAVPPRALQVWCCLAQWTDAGERTTNPTIGRIAGELDISRRAVEMALGELERSGRLVKTSGKAQGRGNGYTLILTRLTRQDGMQILPHQYAENCVPYYNKEVNTKNPITNNPPTPRKRGGARVNPVVPTATPWADFWRAYPRKDQAARARAIWERLAPEDKAAAMAGAAALAQVYAAAPDERRRYTPAAARWLLERRWADDAGALEVHYHAPGAITAAARKAGAAERAAALAAELAARDKARRDQQAEQDRRRNAAKTGA